MLITTVEIENFRYYQGRKCFENLDKPFVLLAAPNGFGKTTLIDAIEWCFTGSIGRLRKSFEARSSTQNEKILNAPGILKNKNCSDTDRVSVKLTLEMNNKEKHTVYRSTSCDAIDNYNLNSEDMIFEVDGEDPAKQPWFKDLIESNSFYNAHVCDTQKAFNLQSDKREKNADSLRDFITDYSKEEVFISNLDQFNKTIKNEKDKAFNKMKIEQSRLDDLQNQENEIVLSNSEIYYPQDKCFSDELLDFTNIDIETVVEQKKKIVQCIFARAVKIQEQIVERVKIQKTTKYINELINYLEDKGTIIDLAIKTGVYSNDGDYLETYSRLSFYNKIELTEDNVFDNAKLIVEQEKLVIEGIEDIRKQIEVLDGVIIKNKKMISKLSDGNEIIDAFSELINKKSIWIEYKEHTSADKIKCPVCGSDRFNEIESRELMNEAEKYLSACSEEITALSQELDEMKKQRKHLYEQVISKVSAIKDILLNKYRNKYLELNIVKEQTKDYFVCIENIKSMQIMFDEEIDYCDVENLHHRVLELSLRANNLTEVLSKKAEIEPLLKRIDYISDNKSEINQLEDFTLYSQGISEPTISCAKLLDKVVFIDNYISRRKSSELQKKIELQRNIAKEFEDKYNSLSKLESDVKQRCKAIRKSVNKCKDKEYNLIWPNLSKVYIKLSKWPGIMNVKIQREGTNNELSFHDEREKQIVNVLSNGQLCVFMLSFFLARVMGFNKGEHFKIYFLDDLTACLDDLNMLSFIDVLKYQVLDGDNVEQLFFSTCDDRIHKLISYKFEKAGIDICELNEDDFKLEYKLSTVN